MYKQKMMSMQYRSIASATSFTLSIILLKPRAKKIFEKSSGQSKGVKQW